MLVIRIHRLIVNSAGTSQNVPPLFSHVCLPVTLLDAYGDSWSPLDSIERAGVIHCETEEDNYSFEVHAYDGSFLVEQQNGKMQYVSDLVIEGVGDAHWENVSSNGEIQPWDGEKTFLGVLIKRDDKYVGYATIMIERPENNWRYNATIINCKELSPEERSNSEIMPEDLYKMIDSAIESAK